MLTGKQKRYLRALGSALDPVVQIGKGGLSEALLISTQEVIGARELIKVRVLKNCMEEPKDAIGELADAVEATLVQVIGRNGLLYKKHPENPKIELP